MSVLKDFIITLDKNNNKSIAKNKSENYIKKQIFSGKIIVFKNLFYIKEILIFTEKIISNYFDPNEILNKVFFSQEELAIFRNKIRLLQVEIKKSSKIKKLFSSMLEEIRFKNDLIYLDKICIRFSHSNKETTLGDLNFSKAHRDTWASNIFQQINWWFPLFDIKDSNTLFICPSYFNKFVKNNSENWSFEDFKKYKGKYPSTPTTNINFNKNEKILIKINRGDLLCFSGHQVHGSNEGLLNRINIETRTVSCNDFNDFKIPENIDCKNISKKSEWFFHILDGKKLSKIY